MSDRRRRQGILLFLAMGLVAAFVVSIVAGLRGTSGRGRGPANVAPGASRIRVEVLNGAGRPGLARRAMERLRARGFDVVYFGNASAFGQDSSVVLARGGRLADAAEVAKALGIPAVKSAPDSTLLLEVTVLLGDDWPPTSHKPGGLLGTLHDLLERGRR